METKTFNFIIDEDRAKLVQLMVTMTEYKWADFTRDMPKDAQQLRPVMMSFVEEFSEKVHERGWCKDPNCHDL